MTLPVIEQQFRRVKGCAKLPLLQQARRPKLSVASHAAA